MAEVPEVDYTAEEEAAMGGETQPKPQVLKPRKGWKRCLRIILRGGDSPKEGLGRPQRR